MQPLDCHPVHASRHITIRFFDSVARSLVMAACENLSKQLRAAITF
jgi:hypothetical protein